MRWVSLPLVWLGASLAGAQDSKPAPVAPPTPAPPAARAATAPPAAPAPVVSELTLAPQPVYGPLWEVTPAHRLALLESGTSLPQNDPEVARFSQFLGQLTARYVEDAGRIAEVTSALCWEIRAKKQSAVPSEILEGALRWTRPPGSRPDVPRKFSEYARRYRTLRVKEGKDHKSALAILNPPPPPPVPRAR